MSDISRFITPETFNEVIKRRNLQGPNGWILFAACNEGIELAEKVKKEYESLLKEEKSNLLKEIPFLNDSAPGAPENKKIIKTFEDTETAPRLPYHVAGSNVYVFQPLHEFQTENTVNENFTQLLQLIWTLKVHGAKTVTAITPYSPYSRQDKPTFLKREATLAKWAANQFIASGVDGIVTYHLHSEGIRGFYEPNVKFTALNGLDLFIEITRQFKGMDKVACVSTDAGGAKPTVILANAQQIDYAVGNKFRPKQEQTDILGIIGNIEGKDIGIIADDESVTVSSLLNTNKELYTRYGIKETYMLISHNKIRPKHVHKLRRAHEEYGLKEFHVTDSIPQTGEILELPFIKIHPLARKLAVVINRLHYNQSVSGLFYRPKD